MLENWKSKFKTGFKYLQFSFFFIYSIVLAGGFAMSAVFYWFNPTISMIAVTLFSGILMIVFFLTANIIKNNIEGDLNSKMKL